MEFFKKTGRNAGRLAIALAGDGVYAAAMQRLPDARPLLLFAVFFPSSKASQAETLERLNRELKAGSYSCTNLLDGGDYQMLTLDAPNVPREELKTAVHWRLKDMLDFHIDDATIDVLDIPADKSAQVRTHTMFAVAARSSLIEQRQRVFAGAKIGLSVIDIPEMAQRNFSAMLEPEARGLAMLSFNDDGGLLTVTFNAELYLARRIDVTLDQLRDSDPQKRQICHEKITLELQRSLDHFERQFQYVAVAKLVLAPVAASGLQEYLASNLYMPVEALDLAQVVDLSKAPELLDLVQQQRFFLVLGAALRQEEVAL